MKKSILSKIDKPLFFMCLLYTIIGAFTILSASSISAVMDYNVSPYYFFIRQCVFVLISYIVGFLIIMRTPTRKYRKYLLWGLVIIFGSLLYVLVKGELVNDARSWIDLGPFSFQPSEFAKTIIIIFFGVFYGDIINTLNSKYSFLIPIIYSILVFFLVFKQPDLGTALIIAAISFFTFFSIPFRNN